MEEDHPKLVGGKVIERDLKSVQPNNWNPNHFTDFELQSLKFGFQRDGWLISQALLIWGKDEKGRQKNIIIDGEHRWTVGCELGFKKGPMVFLNGITEAQAKALTIKLGTKRGTADPTDLGALIREIQASLPGDELALDLGIEQEVLMAHLIVPVDVTPGDGSSEAGTPPGEIPSGQATHVRMVQLFFNKEQHTEFDGLVKKCAGDFQTKDVSATVMEAMRRVSRAAPKSRS